MSTLTSSQRILAEIRSVCRIVKREKERNGMADIANDIAETLETKCFSLRPRNALVFLYCTIIIFSSLKT
jgi:hypothetical protein